MVPLQTHGCYNTYISNSLIAGAVVPLQTHGCYNPEVVKTCPRLGRGSPTDSRVL